MKMHDGCLRVALLSTALLLVSAALTAQSQTAVEPAPQVTPAKESAAEKWLAFSNSWVTARWGWMMLFDALAMTQDSVNEEQVGRVPAKGEPRADRFFLGGQLKFRKPWTYFFGTNFNGLDAEPGKKFSWLDISVDIPLASWLGGVKIGRQKVGLSQEWILPGTDWIFMERSGMANAFIPQRNIGLRLHRSLANGRVTYSAGLFNDWFVNDRSFSANGNQYTARVSFLPVDRNEDQTVVSVATGVYYKEKTEGTLKYRSRPEANQAPYFADTGSFDGDHSTTTQFEVMAMNGPTQLFGELMLTPVKAPTVGDPFFYGGFVGVSHFLTGEHRTFNRDDGHYVGRFVPRSPFSLRRGGIGAWEVAGRYSYVDLTDGAIDGGAMSRITGAISWYPEEHWRIEFNYGHGVLDRGGTRGHFNAFQGRAQFGF
jgi:phosphate-selective porin OprO and OprP